MRSFYGILALLLSVLGQEAFCADLPGDIRFDRVATDILPSNDVRKLFQDSEGYIWIPTYRGLARYDGSGTVICNTAEAGGSMSSTMVNAVAEGEDGEDFTLPENCRLQHHLFFLNSRPRHLDRRRQRTPFQAFGRGGVQSCEAQ